MKKTLTANISGTVFHIEEDAYDALQRYLGNIRGRFAGTAGREDIMADIEARVAELFTERLVGGRQVVSLADVEHVMAIMGQPEDFVEDGPSAEQPGTGGSAAGFTSGPKRFFRDMDDKWVGGVLSGLAAYIGMDPLWLRIAMIVLVWASVGVLIPIYILLWILVPKAETAADRLKMRGEAVTVDNIKRVVEEGAERVKQGGQQFANEARDLGRTWSAGAGKRSSQAAQVIGKIIGIGFIVFAFSLMLGLITGIIGGTFSVWHSTWTSQDTGILDLGELVFTSRYHALWFGIGVFTLLVVPIIGLFLAGFRLLLDTRTPKWMGITLTALWFAAFIPTIWGAMDLANEFKRENSTLTEIQLAQPVSGTLYLDALDPVNNGDWSINFDDGDLDIDLDGLHLEEGNVFGGWGSLDVERSADTLFHLKVQREARGVTSKAALTRAESIQYSYQQKNDALLVSPVVRFSATDKLRAQDVQFTLEVPVGKSIFLRPGSKDVIYDIKNVGNVYDGDMIGRTWTMTERGLLDVNAPPKNGNDEWEAPEAPITPTDTIKAPAPIAAVVWQRTSKRRTVRQPPAQAAVDAEASNSTAHSASLMPDVIGLLTRRIR